MLSRSSNRPKTPAQNRRIWATAHQLALREENLRDLVEAVTGKRSISGLSFRNATLVIRELEGLATERRRAHKRLGAPSDRVNAGQIKYIRDLAAQAGWDEWALRSWLKRWFRADHEQWLDNKHAVKAITALKAMVYRKARAQRKDDGA